MQPKLLEDIRLNPKVILAHQLLSFLTLVFVRPDAPQLTTGNEAVDVGLEMHRMLINELRMKHPAKNQGYIKLSVMGHSIMGSCLVGGLNSGMGGVNGILKNDEIAYVMMLKIL